MALQIEIRLLCRALIGPADSRQVREPKVLVDRSIPYRHNLRLRERHGLHPHVAALGLSQQIVNPVLLHNLAVFLRLFMIYEGLIRSCVLQRRGMHTIEPLFLQLCLFLLDFDPELLLSSSLLVPH